MLGEWPEGEVRRIVDEWQDHDDRTWVVLFDLANRRGRIECVGMSLRSGLLARTERIGLVVRAGWDDPNGLPLDPRDCLQPLSATTLRQLPFDDVLVRARRSHAGLVRRSEKMILGETIGGSKAKEAFERTARDFELSGKAGGHRSKYGSVFLARVARIYQAAYENGESAPAKLVGRELKLTPDVARKLVHRCRLSHLLPPAEGTKARGWLEGERDEATDKGGAP
jgi:hypothetical protein